MSNANAGAVGSTGGADRLREDLEAMKNDFAALRDDLRVFAQDAGSAARTGAASAAERLRQGGREALDSARAKGRQAKEQVQGQIEDHPFMAVGVAFGVGLLVGAIIARR